MCANVYVRYSQLCMLMSDSCLCMSDILSDGIIMYANE